MNIVVLTYDHPHRKTEDVVCRLMMNGYEVDLVAVPWIERKQRRYIYGHRPAERNWPCEPTADPKFYAEKMGLRYTVVEKPDLFSAINEWLPSVVVVGGAGILPKAVVNDFRVLNIHPGLLPARRGLDVLKWSVIDCKPVGVTAHICDEETDLGWRLIERTVPVFTGDTFHSFAMRQYEYELSTLIPAIDMLEVNEDRAAFDRITPGETKAFKRMPITVEAGLIQAFERYKRVYA